LHLKVNEKKSAIRRPLDYEYLGFAFESIYRKGERGQYQLVVSKDGFAELKYKIKEITRKTNPASFDERIDRINWYEPQGKTWTHCSPEYLGGKTILACPTTGGLNLLMRGWLNYFRPASMYGKLKAMDGWVRNRLRYCIWHHWMKPRRRVKNLIRLGVPERMAWQWAHSRMRGWAVSCSSILTTTINLDRLKRRGYKSFLNYYLEIR
jgi:hypothetical protein